MHPGGVHRDPHADGDDEVRRAAPEPEPEAHEQHQPDAGGGQRERAEREVVGVEDRDDRQRAHVVGHGEGEQEQPQLRRAGGADEHEHAEQERGVGGDDDAPRRRRLPAGVEQQVDQRRDGQPGDGRRERHRGPPPVGELAHHQLALDLEPDDEEEEHHEAVVDPVLEVQRQLRTPEAERELGVPEGLVGLRPRRVGPDDGGDGGEEQQRGAARLVRGEGPQRGGHLREEVAAARAGLPDAG